MEVLRSIIKLDKYMKRLKCVKRKLKKWFINSLKENIPGIIGVFVIIELFRRNINKYLYIIKNNNAKYAFVKLKNTQYPLLLIVCDGTYDFCNNIIAAAECIVYAYVNGYPRKLG